MSLWKADLNKYWATFIITLYIKYILYKRVIMALQNVLCSTFCILMHRTAYEIKLTHTTAYSYYRNRIYVGRNIESRSRNHCYSVTEICITNFEHVSVALGMHHTKHMRCMILSSVACLAVPYFSKYRIHCKIFGGENVQYITFLYHFCLKHFQF